jgi:hypothetical protein
MTDENAVAAPSPIDGKRRAAAVLEVLGGARTPQEAAQSLALCLPAYYQLEARALQGLGDACEPRRRGRLPATSVPEVDRLKGEVVRLQSLLRSMNRSLGLADEVADVGRRRRPSIRALRAARKLSS